MACVFCTMEKEVLSHKLAYAIFDKYPVSDGHMLVITRRHTPTFFETTGEERMALFNLVDECKQLIDRRYGPDAYNIGMNIGQTAGQSVMHVHIHVIPRYKGDVENPLGGVRGVIPDKRIYGGPKPECFR